MTASEKLDRAVPGPKWTTDKIIKLAKELLEENGDLSGEAMYSLQMLAVKDEEEVQAMISALHEQWWEAKGKKPPPIEEVE